MPARYGTWLLALGGLALACIALWQPAAPVPDGPASRLLVQLPGWVQTLLAVAMIVEFLAIVLLLVQAPRQKRQVRRPGQSRLSPAALALLLLPVLTATFVSVYVLQHLDENALRLVLLDLNLFGGGSPMGDAAQQRVPVTLPWVNLGLSAGTSIAAVVIIALSALVIVLNPPWRVLTGLLRARPQPDQAASDIARGFAAGRRELALGADPRSAVIACYRQCEAALATRRRRPAWETSREFLYTALTALQLPGIAVTTLLRIFERARYSELPVTQQDRSDVLHALDTICQELRRRGEEQGAA